MEGEEGVVWELRDMELEIACDVFVDELVVGVGADGACGTSGS